MLRVRGRTEETLSTKVKDLTLKIFEAFAGYGTATHALKELKIPHEIVGWSEIDKYAIQCFTQNHGGKNYGDISQIDWNTVPDFDLLTGGFPCTDVSSAGKQDLSLGRTTLGYELVEALRIKQPKYFLFENVKGLTQRKFNDFRKDLIGELGQQGYIIFTKILNTRDFGVPQNRERVWFVGFRKDLWSSNELKYFGWPEEQKLELKLKDILEPEVDERYFLKEGSLNYLKDRREKNSISGIGFGAVFNPSIASAIDSRYAACRNSGETYIGDEKELYAIGAAIRTRTLDGKPATLELREDEVSNSLDSSSKDTLIVHNLQPRSENRPSILKNRALGLPDGGGSGHLTKKDGTTYCLDSGNTQAVEYGARIRRLTPKECFRLQGFLRDQIDLSSLSDTQCYKLAGNGQSLNVVVLLLKEILRGN